MAERPPLERERLRVLVAIAERIARKRREARSRLRVVTEDEAA